MLCVILMLLASATAVQGDRAPAAVDVARSVQKAYDTVRDFSADFEQTYVGGALGQQATERGTLLVKKPGKMRWTYTSPEKKVFVSDGVKLYSYVPADRQVTVSTVPAGNDAGTPALFLAGKGNLTRDFVATFTEVPGAPADSWALKLVPTRREPDYEWLLLVVDRRTFQLRMLVTTDAQGGRSTFTFSRLKENLNVLDKEFVFKIPPGVEVITAGR
jgi:outer membrane lipoprotein carrier protein